MTTSFFAAALVCSIVITAITPVALASGPVPIVGPRKAVPVTLYGRFTSPSGWGYGPNNVTLPGPPLAVDQGDVITFTLYAGDSQLHDLVIDLNSNNVAEPSEPKSADFTSPTTPITFVYTANTAGNLQYICGYHGGSTMRGLLTVRSATSPPPSGDNTPLIIGGVVVLVVVVAAAGALMMRRRKPKEPPQTPPQT
jgi:plastocyanin